MDRLTSLDICVQVKDFTSNAVVVVKVISLQFNIFSMFTFKKVKLL